jgi:hypothetical protein
VRCSVCELELKGAVYTISALTLSERALCVNTCRACLTSWLGRPGLRALDRLLDRSGWVQPALLSLG